MRYGLFIFTLLIAGCALSLANRAFADLATDFLKHAPERWAALERTYRTLQIEVDCTTTMVQKDGGEKRIHERWLYKRNGTWQSIEKEPLDNDAIPSLVYAKNSRYWLKLTKDRGSKDWFVNEATFDPSEGETVEAAVDGITQRVMDIGWALPFSPWATIVNSPNFKLVSCVDDSGPAQGSQLVKVDFDFRPTENELDLPKRGGSKATLKSISGTLVMDKEQYWAITDYDVRALFVMAGNPMPTEARYKATVKYALLQAPSGATVPVPVQLGLEMTGLGGSLKKEIEVVETSLKDLPEKDFTLVAYGLPDMGKPSTGSIGGRSVAGYIFFIASIIGIIALLLARNRLGRSEQH